MVPESHTIQDLNQKSMKANGWGVLRIIKGPSIHPSYGSQLLGEVRPAKLNYYFMLWIIFLNNISTNADGLSKFTPLLHANCSEQHLIHATPIS